MALPTSVAPLIASLWFVLTYLGCTAAQAETTQLSLVLHSPPKIEELSVNEARAIFSMRMRIWPDGSPITVFVLPHDAPKHNHFVRSILKLLPHQLKRNWDRLVYTGIGQAPLEVANEQQMIQQLKATPGSIGYINSGSRDETLHLIKLR